MSPQALIPNNTPANPDRKQAIEALFTQVSPRLQNTLYSYIDGLLVQDCHSILSRIPVQSYTGPIDVEVFGAWVEIVAMSLADHARLGYDIQEAYLKLLSAAIREDPPSAGSKFSADGFIEEAADHVQNLAVAVYDPERMHGRMREPCRKAKMSTRLYSACRSNTRNTRTQRNRRQAIVARHDHEIAGGGCEYVSNPSEIAETCNVDEHDQDAA